MGRRVPRAAAAVAASARDAGDVPELGPVRPTPRPVPVPPDRGVRRGANVRDRVPRSTRPRARVRRLHATLRGHDPDTGDDLPHRRAVATAVGALRRDRLLRRRRAPGRDSRRRGDGAVPRGKRARRPHHGAGERARLARGDAAPTCADATCARADRRGAPGRRQHVRPARPGAHHHETVRHGHRVPRHGNAAPMGPADVRPTRDCRPPISPQPWRCGAYGSPPACCPTRPAPPAIERARQLVRQRNEDAAYERPASHG